MKTIEKTSGSKALDLTMAQPTNANHDGLSPMPEEFAGLFESGYDAGYTSGREAGYRRGYEAGYADARKEGNAGADVAATAAEPKAAQACRSPLLLLGLPCPNCRIYSSAKEALCLWCKTVKVSAQDGRNQFAVTGDTSVSL